MATTPEVSLSVVSLAEFSARTGDLMSAGGGPTALEGILGHRRVQQLRMQQAATDSKSEWRKEVSLKHNFEMLGYQVSLQGRADLLSESDHGLIIDEIKTSYEPLGQCSPQRLALYWAQAELYAWLVCQRRLSQDQALPANIELRIGIYDLLREQLEFTSQTFNWAELNQHCRQWLTSYLQWRRELDTHRTAVQSSAAELEFPFQPYRAGQRELAVKIYLAITRQHPLLAQAPTGTGKTVTALFPAIKALGKGKGQQVIYATAKTSAQRQAMETLRQLVLRGLQIDYLVITARATTCFCLTEPGSEQGCTYCTGYFDRLPEARRACLRKQHLNREALETIAQHHHVCPFALSVHMSQWATLVIADVNYLYDPVVTLTSLQPTNRSASALLLDEAHNLPSRAQAMYSAELSQALLRRLKERWPQQAVADPCQNLDAIIASLAGQSPCGAAPPALQETLAVLLVGIQSLQRDNQNDLFQSAAAETDTEDLMSLYRFATLIDNIGTAHFVLTVATEPPQRPSDRVNDWVLKVFCVDAREYLAKINGSFRSTIAFSATVTPMTYYAQALGLSAQHSTVALTSPFPPENQLTLDIQYIDTRWRNREQSLPQLVALIEQTYRAHPGKYLVFLPSYAYLSSVFSRFIAQVDDVDALCQMAHSNRETQQTFIEGFLNDANPKIGFAILGGIFAEGIDYAGEALDGAIVVGTGMAKPDTENRLKKSWHDLRGEDGFAHTYLFPGLTKVTQTAGRVIRSERDRGVVILVDPRFKQSTFRRLLPEHWRFSACLSPADTASQLAEFWYHSEDRPRQP